MIEDINQINTDTEDGKLLLAALAIITSELYTNKTPAQVISTLNARVCSMGLNE